MKLRLRSLVSKETLKLEVPNACTIRELKETLSFRISNGGSSSSMPPGQLFLTLNLKDELSGSSLQSVGVTSGDLIFYSLNPNPDESSSQAANLYNQIDDIEKSGAENVPSVESKNMADDRSPELKSGDPMIEELADSPQAVVKETLKLSTSRKRPNEPEGHEISCGEVEDMAVDDDVSDDAYLRSLPVPSFLKNVFENEIGSSSSSGNGSDNMLLKVAVHAVLLESGFVAYDPVSCTKRDGFRLPDKFPLSPLHYTIPEVLSSRSVQTVAVKFQNLGKFVNVNGSLTNKFIYHVCLDVSRFAPAFNLVWKNGNTDSPVDSMLKNPESDVFEFWKHVKDGIALPLLIDLCESVGIAPPSSLMLLPTYLKLKILELLPGTDIAKIACSCSEMCFISSNNDVWRQKYKEEFGYAETMDTECSWKLKFSWAWSAWKKRKTETESFCRTRLYGFRTPHYPFRDPALFGVPRIIGGDYDLHPGLVPNPFGRRHPRPMYPNFNFGGFNV